MHKTLSGVCSLFSAATSSVQTFRIGKSITNGEGEKFEEKLKLVICRHGLPHLLAAPRLGKL